MNTLYSIRSDIEGNGIHLFGELLDQEKTGLLYKKILADRQFDSSLFLSEKDFLLQENHFGANPTTTFNFLNKFSEELNLIEEHPQLNETLSFLLGSDYEIVIKKLVCGVPDAWLPEWVRVIIKGTKVANLGPYIKKEYRDITYFRGIDYHQDIIDWRKGTTDLDPSTFLTMYVYLHDVDEYDSPLHILIGSHKLGATLFPHKLTKLEDDLWKYGDDLENEIKCKDIKLMGKTGYVALWHNCLLHGTQPVQNESETFRLSLRYLIGKSNNNKTETIINHINSKITGELKPIKTRVDLDDSGRPKMKGNIINRQKP